MKGVKCCKCDKWTYKIYRCGTKTGRRRYSGYLCSKCALEDYEQLEAKRLDIIKGLHESLNKQNKKLIKLLSQE